MRKGVFQLITTTQGHPRLQNSLAAELDESYEPGRPQHEQISSEERVKERRKRSALGDDVPLHSHSHSRSPRSLTSSCQLTSSEVLVRSSQCSVHLAERLFARGCNFCGERKELSNPQAKNAYDDRVLPSPRQADKLFVAPLEAQLLQMVLRRH